MKLVLLPGLDGTGQLFQPLMVACDQALALVVVPYDCNRVQTYEELLCHIKKQLPAEETYVVLAESFSGPLAMMLGAENPQNLKGIVLCNTFTRPPVPQWLALFPWSLFLAATPPHWAIRCLLAGPNASNYQCNQIQAAIHSVSAATLGARVNEILIVDTQSQISKAKVPILFLHSTQDRLVSAKSVKRIVNLNPEIHLATLPGPHLLLQTRPYESWHIIKNFLREYIGIDI